MRDSWRQFSTAVLARWVLYSKGEHREVSCTHIAKKKHGWFIACFGSQNLLNTLRIIKVSPADLLHPILLTFPEAGRILARLS